jgi:hypothetical protein
MRKVLLFSAVAMLAACADDQHSTAPAGAHSAASARSTAAGAVGASEIGVAPLGKPTDQVGLTKVTSYSSATYDVPANSVANQVLFCPTGSVVTGGGFRVPPGALDHPAYVQESAQFENGWRVGVINLATGSTGTLLTIYVNCAS